MSDLKPLATFLDGAREAPPPSQMEKPGSIMQPVRINGVPTERWKANTFASFKATAAMRSAFNQCEAVAAGREWCALLAGPTGNGKTHLAIAAMHSFPHAYLWKVPDFLAEMRKRQFEDDFDRVIDGLQTDRVPGVYGQTTAGNVELAAPFQMRRLLVFDDLGTENRTDWAMEQLYRVLDARYDFRLPTIITTNQEPDRIDARILSRFSAGLVPCLAPDYRRSERNPA